jgi:hypothetical protein
VGYVQVNLGRDVSARTILPSGEGLYYTLTYINPLDSSDTGDISLGSVSSGGKTVNIPTGTWNLVVYGYRNPVDSQEGPEVSVVSGSESNITISTGTNPPVTIKLGASQTGRGTLRYSVTYPNNISVSDVRLKLEKIAPSQTIMFSSVTNTGQIPLASGFYQLTFYVYNGKIAVTGDLVHIYDDLETPAVFALSNDNFSTPPANYLDLEAKKADALTARNGVKISTDGSDVLPADRWITTGNMDTLNNAIAAAEAVLAEYGAGRNFGDIDDLIEDLEDALGPIGDGTYNPATDSTPLGLFNGSSTQIAAAGTSLAEVLAWLADPANSASIIDTIYTIRIGADEDLSSWTFGGSGTGAVFNGKTGIILNIEGRVVEQVISLNSTGRLFTVNNGVELVLVNNITLRGWANNDSELVRISSGGKFTMQGNTKITGNTNTSSSSNSSGGVYVEANGIFTMSGGEISGNNSSSTFYSGGGVYMANGTFTMTDGKISGNNASSSNYSGGGVYMANGIFTMSGGEISGNNNSSTNSSGGGVYVYGGNFSMGGSASVSGNTSSSNSSGGGVYVYGGSFSMEDNALVSGNTSSKDDSGGGVYVYGGNFSMGGSASVSGNTSSSDDSGGGVYVAGGSFSMNGSASVRKNASSSSSSSPSYGGVYVAGGRFSMDGSASVEENTFSSAGSGVYVAAGGAFAMSGGALVNVNNPVYLANTSAITIDTLDTGTSAVALVQPAPAPPGSNQVPGYFDFIGNPFIKWAVDLSAPLPVDRFTLANGWTADTDGKLKIKALALDSPNTYTEEAYLGGGNVHFYRFTLDAYVGYTVTRTRINGSGIYTAVAWEDTGERLMTNTSSNATSTSTAFTPTRAGDVIIMVCSGTGNYTVKYDIVP